MKSSDAKTLLDELVDAVQDIDVIVGLGATPSSLGEREVRYKEARSAIHRFLLKCKDIDLVTPHSILKDNKNRTRPLKLWDRVELLNDLIETVDGVTKATKGTKGWRGTINAVLPENTYRVMFTSSGNRWDFVLKPEDLKFVSR